MLCPKCKYEYREGLTECPDCNIPMIDRPMASGGAAAVPDNTWVEICAVTRGPESILVKGALDSSNIPSEIVPGEFSSRYPGAGDITDGIPSVSKGNILLVPEEFKETATVVIEAVLGDDFVESGRS